MVFYFLVMTHKDRKSKFEGILKQYFEGMRETSVLTNPMIVSAVNRTRGEIATEDCDLFSRLLGDDSLGERHFGKRLKSNRQRSYFCRLAYEISEGVNLAGFLPIAAAMDVIDGGCYYSLDDILDNDVVVNTPVIKDKIVFSHIYQTIASQLVCDGIRCLDLPVYSATEILENWIKFMRWTLEGFYIEQHNTKPDKNFYERRTRAYGAWEFVFKVAGLAAKSDKYENLREAGRNLGMAFMITNDTLDIAKDFADIRDGYYTLPIMVFMERADEEQKRVFNRCFGNPNADKGDLFEIGQSMVRLGVVDYCLDAHVSPHVSAFFDGLDRFADCTSKTMLMCGTSMLYGNYLYKILRERYSYERKARNPLKEKLMKGEQDAI